MLNARNIHIHCARVYMYTQHIFTYKKQTEYEKKTKTIENVFSEVELAFVRDL